MLKFNGILDSGFVERYKRESIQNIERAALVATDKVTREALTEVRRSGKLGRLGNALGHFSDLKKGKVYRFGKEGFAASGGIAVKTRNERTHGALISMIEGADILPVKGPWLWIATPELAIKRVNKKKITPALYRSGGFEQRLGPLVQIPGRHAGEALLIIKNVQTSISGNRRPIKGARSGIARAGREQKAFIVAFVGIRRTSRTSVINVKAIVRAASERISQYMSDEIRKGI